MDGQTLYKYIAVAKEFAPCIVGLGMLTYGLIGAVRHNLSNRRKYLLRDK